MNDEQPSQGDAWYVIDEGSLREYLQTVHDGEDPDIVLMSIFVNCDAD